MLVLYINSEVMIQFENGFSRSNSLVPTQTVLETRPSTDTLSKTRGERRFPPIASILHLIDIL